MAKKKDPRYTRNNLRRQDAFSSQQTVRPPSCYVNFPQLPPAIHYDQRTTRIRKSGSVYSSVRFLDEIENNSKEDDQKLCFGPFSNAYSLVHCRDGVGKSEPTLRFEPDGRDREQLNYSSVISISRSEIHPPPYNNYNNCNEKRSREGLADLPAYENAVWRPMTKAEAQFYQNLRSTPYANIESIRHYHLTKPQPRLEFVGTKKMTPKMLRKQQQQFPTSPRQPRRVMVDNHNLSNDDERLVASFVVDRPRSGDASTESHRRAALALSIVAIFCGSWLCTVPALVLALAPSCTASPYQSASTTSPGSNRAAKSMYIASIFLAIFAIITAVVLVTIYVATIS